MFNQHCIQIQNEKIPVSIEIHSKTIRKLQLEK